MKSMAIVAALASFHAVHTGPNRIEVTVNPGVYEIEACADNGVLVCGGYRPRVIHARKRRTVGVSNRTLTFIPAPAGEETMFWRPARTDVVYITKRGKHEATTRIVRPAGGGDTLAAR